MTSPEIVPSRTSIDMAIMPPEIRFLRDNSQIYIQNFLQSGIFQEITSHNVSGDSVLYSLGGSEAVGFVILAENQHYIVKFTDRQERASKEAQKLLLWERNGVHVPHVFGYGQIIPTNLPSAGYIVMEAVALEGKLAQNVMNALRLDPSLAVPLGALAARELVKMHTTSIPEGLFPTETPTSIMENSYSRSICDLTGIGYDILHEKVKDATDKADVSFIHGDFSPLGNILVSSYNPPHLSLIDPFPHVGDPYEDLVTMLWSIGIEEFFAKKLDANDAAPIQALQIFTQNVYSEYERLTEHKIDLQRFQANLITFLIKKCHEQLALQENDRYFTNEILAIYKEKLAEAVGTFLHGPSEEENQASYQLVP